MPSEHPTKEIDDILGKAKAAASFPRAPGISKIVDVLISGFIGLAFVLLNHYFGWSIAMAFGVIVLLAAWIFKKLR